MSISDLDQKWFDFTGQYVDKLNQNNGDWSQLTKEEQELAAIWRLEMDVHNGGFLQFFTNWGIDCYEHAIRCLKKIGAKKSLDIILSSFTVIDKYKEDKRLKAYSDLYKLISEDDHTQLDLLDNQYWELPDNIQELTFRVYQVR